MNIIRKNEKEVNEIMVLVFKFTLFFMTPFYYLYAFVILPGDQLVSDMIIVFVSNIIIPTIILFIYKKSLVSEVNFKYVAIVGTTCISFSILSSMYYDYLLCTLFPMSVACLYFDKKLIKISGIIGVVSFFISDVLAVSKSTQILALSKWTYFHTFNVGLQVLILGVILHGAARRATSMISEIARQEEINKLQKDKAENLSNRLIQTEDIALCGSWEYDILNNELILSRNNFKRNGIVIDKDEATLKGDEFPKFFNDILIHKDGKKYNFSDVIESGNMLSVYGIDDNNLLEGKIYEVEYSYKSTDMILVNYSKPIIENGKLVKILGVSKDITKERKHEQELINAKEIAEEASASQSRFVANMSHEIRTPLNAILGYTEILKGFNRDEKMEYYFNAIDSSGNILLDVITDILDFAKVNAGKYRASYIPCNIGDFLEEVKILFWKTLDTKDLDFELIYDTCSPTLMLPISIMRQIIINIVGNAIKFTNDGGILVKVISMKRGDTYDIDISVIDTGIGIEKSKQDFIFEEFEQADESHVKSGTGLGLAISKKFAEIIGASISLESEIGKGSTFTLKLKGIEVSDVDVDSAYNKNEKIDFEFMSQRTMIIDDIKDNREVLKAHCENLNLIPKTYYSAKDALKNIKLFKPDIILTDLRMPEMDGEIFAKYVREQDPSIPIICITASINPDEKYDLKYFDDVLNKPVASSILAKIMSKYLESKSLEENSVFNIDKAYDEINLTDEEFNTFKNQYFEQVKIQKFVLNIKTIKKISKEITSYGENIDNKVLENIGKTLETASRNLDIDSIRNIINGLNEYLENE